MAGSPSAAGVRPSARVSARARSSASASSATWASSRRDTAPPPITPHPCGAASHRRVPTRPASPPAGSGEPGPPARWAVGFEQQRHPTGAKRVGKSDRRRRPGCSGGMPFSSLWNRPVADCCSAVRSSTHRLGSGSRAQVLVTASRLISHSWASEAFGTPSATRARSCATCSASSARARPRQAPRSRASAMLSLWRLAVSTPFDTRVTGPRRRCLSRPARPPAAGCTSSTRRSPLPGPRMWSAPKPLRVRGKSARTAFPPASSSPTRATGVDLRPTAVVPGAGHVSAGLWGGCPGYVRVV